ncbi:MAG: LysM peptidoglycan-binding domain-containing protein [Candidatus Auribacterota bacterium]|nr:LysM peptidoglycan-binding domain-containing protein [Candidatus Auribacterota bacterium]
MFRNYLIGTFLLAITGVCFAQQVIEEEIITQRQQVIPSSTKSSGGYMTEGSTTYGIKGVVLEDDSPMTELKLLRKKFLTEIKRTEKMESENRMLQERLEHLTILLEKKNHELEAMQENTLSLRFKCVSIENKLTNLRMAILRKKLIRESKYPPYYEVKKNDSLWRIAAMRNIYDDPYKWINIYHANKDKIADPDYIYPGMILTIDRPEMQYEDWTVEGLELDSLKDKISFSDAEKISQEDPSVFPVNLDDPIDLDKDFYPAEEVIIESDDLSKDSDSPDESE